MTEKEQLAALKALEEVEKAILALQYWYGQRDQYGDPAPDRVERGAVLSAVQGVKDKYLQEPTT